jgi:outer membrane protein
MRLAGVLALFGIFVGAISVQAQEILRLEDAISIALNNNYSIKLVANDQAIAQNNVSLGNAGMLPVVSADAAAAMSIQNTRQTLLSGEVREMDNARNRNSSYGANLRWTIFDGFQMFARYEQLQQLELRSEAQLKGAILQTVSGVLSTYYELIQQRQLILATETALELSQFRYQTAENRYQIGRASKLEVLSASVDLNTDTTNLLRQRDQYRNAQVRLNELMARDPHLEFEVAQEFSMNEVLNFEELLNAALQLNPTLKVAILDQRFAELEEKRIKGQRYPQVNLTSAYTRSNSRNAIGFSTESQNIGLNFGISASMNIFNGFIQKKNERNAKIQVESAEIQVEALTKEIEASLLMAFRTYTTNMELVRLEASNREIAQENLEITLEKFKLGSIAPLEFREAQRNFVDASTRYSIALYQSKMAEIALKQIAGTLVLD